MPIEHDLRSFLVSRPSINAITTEIYRNDLPERHGETYIQYKRNRANDDLTRDGYGGLIESVFTVDCIGDTQDQADDLAEAVKAALQTFNELVQSSQPFMGNTAIKGLFLRDKSDDYTPFPLASDEVVPFSSMEAEIHHL